MKKYSTVLSALVSPEAREAVEAFVASHPCNTYGPEPAAALTALLEHPSAFDSAPFMHTRPLRLDGWAYFHLPVPG